MAYRMSEAALDARVRAGRANSIPVMVDGVEYVNMMAAEEATGIENLARQLRGLAVGGSKEVRGHTITKLKTSIPRGGVKIYKYDYECSELLEEYDSVAEAADSNDVSCPNMSVYTKNGVYKHKKSNSCYSRVKL